MRVALVNPQWSFDHSIYFGCREPHLPLEYGCAKTLLQAAGHEAEIIDGQLFGLPHAEMAQAVRDFRPDMTVVTTAPSYLFWRCAPPEPSASAYSLNRTGNCCSSTSIGGDFEMPIVEQP